MADQPISEPVQGRAGLLPFYKGVAGLFTALVLVQAFLAGRGWFIDFDLFDLHRVLGEFTTLCAIVLLVLAVLATPGRPERRGLIVMTALIAVLTVVQLSLGYASEDSSSAAAWHIPTGVLLFGLSVGHNSLAFRLR